VLTPIEALALSKAIYGQNVIGIVSKGCLDSYKGKRHIWHRLTDGCQERQEASDLRFMMRPSIPADALPRLLASRL
jgi:hypothetical protein